jgi:hypothetical protein
LTQDVFVRNDAAGLAIGLAAKRLLTTRKAHERFATQAIASSLLYRATLPASSRDEGCRRRFAEL